MSLEIDVEEAVCEQALSLGVTSKKLKATGERGYPDRIFWVPGGRPLLIEFKRPEDGALSALQKVLIRRLRHYGYQVEICDNVEQALGYIKAALEPARVPEKSREVSAGT